jgi:type II secretory ATPase GspE/PulE/Tfp pilus assembly ATPase PilB-like protein
VGAVIRLLDMGIAPYCIAYALRCVVAQRFVRQLCPHCKRSMQPPQHVLAITKVPRPIYGAAGCAECGKTGVHGRIPLFEFLPVGPAFRRAVYGSCSPDELLSVAGKNGLISMWHDGLDKVFAGVTSLEEVLRVVRGIRDSSAGQPRRPQDGRSGLIRRAVAKGGTPASERATERRGPVTRPEAKPPV